MMSSVTPAPAPSRARLTRRELSASLGALSALAFLSGARRSSAQSSLERLSAVATGELEELARWATAQDARVSAHVSDALSGRELAGSSAHVPLNPASNQKILTMAVALEQLGPEHRFSTALHGRFSGDGLSELVLRGNGDPDLTVDDLGRMVRDLRSQGVQRVVGDIFVDQSVFDSLWNPPVYERHPNDWATYRAPVSAVAVNGNTVTLHVAPSAAGDPARVWVSPDGLATVRGTVLTGPAARTHDVRLSVRARADSLELLVGGSVPSNSRALAFGRRLAEPELAAGRVLVALLREHRIAFTGSVRRGGQDVQAERAVQRSRSLAEILHALGKRSDNFVAEMLLKAVAVQANGAPGTSAGGASVIEAYLTRLGALEAGTRLLNGSGLYDANRVSAFTLTRVLSAAAADARIFPELVASLAIGGVDGTLSQRFVPLRGQRAIRAKTGTLAGVTALGGYVLRAPPNGPVAFAILVNGVVGKLPEARGRIDRALEAVARAC